MAHRAQGALAQREGAHTPARHRRGGAARAALGEGDQGLRVRYRAGQEIPGRPVWRQQPVDRASLHVAARSRFRLPELLVRSRSRRRCARASDQSRCELCAHRARADREAARLRQAPRLEGRVGVVTEQRLQLRLSRVVYQGRACEWRNLLQFRGQRRSREPRERRTAGLERVLQGRARHRVSHVLVLRARQRRGDQHVRLSRRDATKGKSWIG